MILVCIISVAATTFAYLHNASDIVKNTFTVGKVDISLDEAKVNEDGKPVDEDGNIVALKDAPRVTKNEYKLLPGRIYTKDPTVYVEEGSEVCIVFVLIYIPDSINAVMLHNSDYSIEKQVEKTWHQLSHERVVQVEGGKYLLFGQLDVTAGSVLPLFDNIAIRPDATSEELEKAEREEIVITAYAIQSEGFEGDNVKADDLWTDILVKKFDPFGTNS
jgi:hypothetical protein